MQNDFKRFFTPNKVLWKYIKQNQTMKSDSRDDKVEHIVDNSNELLDFAISFTKTVVRLSFVLFIAVNVYVLTMTTVNYIINRELLFIDTLITESYSMLRDVIAAYIIKAATENSLRIAFSVISDYLEKKYNLKPIKPIFPDVTDFDNYNTENDTYTDVYVEEDDPGVEFEEEDTYQEETEDTSNIEEEIQDEGGSLELIDEADLKKEVEEKPIVTIVDNNKVDENLLSLAYDDGGIDFL